jgi:uncharacterized protein (TIGR02145 family)
VGRESLAPRFPKRRTLFVALGTLAFITLSFGLYNISQTLIANIEYKPTPIASDGQPIDTMQEMTPTICATMDTYSSLTLEDARNNQDYRVRKMPDGKCWMIDNLKLATPGIALTLDHNNSNITDDQYTFVIPANPVQSAATHANGRCDSGGTLANGDGYLTCNGTATQSATNSGFAAYSDPSDDSTLTTTISCAQREMVDPASTTGCGYLYNWYTATAGTGTYDISSGYVTSSICPAGWHLPRGNDGTTAQNEFAVLNSAMYNGSLTGMGYTTDTQYVQNWWHTGLFAGPRSGYYGPGFVDQGDNGRFWSSSANSSTLTWYFSFRYSLVNPGMNNGYVKYYGFAVRCVV